MKKEKNVFDHLKIILGWFLIIIGMVALLIPIIPGIVLIILGLSLIGHAAITKQLKRKK